MRTHTIRNKSKHTPILSLAPDFMAKMLSARIDSAALVIAHFIKNYEAITGKRPALEHGQHHALLTKAGAGENEQWVSTYRNLPAEQAKILEYFMHGFLAAPISTKSMEEDLLIAELFFDILDGKPMNESPAHSPS